MIYNWGCIIIMKTKMEYKPYSDDRNIISPFLFDVVFLFTKKSFLKKNITLIYMDSNSVSIYLPFLSNVLHNIGIISTCKGSKGNFSPSTENKPDSTFGIIL